MTRNAFWLRFAAYALPLAFFLYVLYWNVLPFGYEKNFTVLVGSAGDTDTDEEFYLESSKNLSEPKTLPDGSTYRTLSGLAYAVFKPTAVLRDASLTVSVEGDGVSIIPPEITFDPSSVAWDYTVDFTTKKIGSLVKNTPITYDDLSFFDGETKFELPDSADHFENSPFTLYAEWMPEDGSKNAQQIVGHYNWELWQNALNVEFRVGRMNDATGPAYSVKYPVPDPDTFFTTPHTAVATYSPSDNGFIELFVDGEFAGRTYIGKDTIWKGYGSDKYNLSLGWSPHNYGNNPYLSGYIYKILYTNKVIIAKHTLTNLNYKYNQNNSIAIASEEAGSIKKINLYVKKN